MTCVAEAFRTRAAAKEALGRFLARLKTNGGNPHVWSQIDLHQCRRCGRWHYRHQKPTRREGTGEVESAAKTLGPIRRMAERNVV